MYTCTSFVILYNYFYSFFKIYLQGTGSLLDEKSNSVEALPVVAEF